MTKRYLLFYSIPVLVVVAAASAYAIDTSKMRGHDAAGKLTEEPRVMFTGAGDVSVRFAAEESPRLNKWWNGRLVVNCPIGYHFKVEVGAGGEHSGLYNEQATCEPNPK